MDESNFFWRHRGTNDQLSVGPVSELSEFVVGSVGVAPKEKKVRPIQRKKKFWAKKDSLFGTEKEKSSFKTIFSSDGFWTFESCAWKTMKSKND